MLESGLVSDSGLRKRESAERLGQQRKDKGTELARHLQKNLGYQLEASARLERLFSRVAGGRGARKWRKWEREQCRNLENFARMQAR